MLELQFLDGAAIEAAKAAAGDPEGALAPALARLRNEAEASLQRGPFSVTDVAALPPSGNPREYRSWGSYWWPDPDRADGLPWIRRDGVTHPDALGTREPMRNMIHHVETLALAYQVFGTPAYASHALELLRIF